MRVESGVKLGTSSSEESKILAVFTVLAPLMIESNFFANRFSLFGTVGLRRSLVEMIGYPREISSTNFFRASEFRYSACPF